MLEKPSTACSGINGEWILLGITVVMITIITTTMSIKCVNDATNEHRKHNSNNNIVESGNIDNTNIKLRGKGSSPPHTVGTWRAPKGGRYPEPFVLLEPPAQNPGCSCVVA